MSIYKLSPLSERIYKEISHAMDSLQLSVRLPRASTEEILFVYNKVISENRNGFFYRPGSVRTRSSFTETMLYMDMCVEAQRRIEFGSRVEFEASSIIAEAERERTDYEKLLRVYQYFVKNFKYARGDLENVKYHTAASPFLYREAVCEGFAFAFAFIANRMRIPCGIVMGVSAMNEANGAHAWNIVSIGNRFYHVDVTWDICTKEKGNNLFDYFLLDDNLIRKNHRWNDRSIPCCADASKDFYAFNGQCCHNRTDIVNVLKNHLKLRKRDIGLRYMGAFTENIINSDSLLEMFGEAVRQAGCFYSEVQYGFNSGTGTAYFNITY